MSAEAARIISKISKRKQTSGFEPMLGTVKSVSPLTVKFDVVGFDVSDLLVNSLFMGHIRKADVSSSALNLPDSKINFEADLSSGDRVAGMAVGGTQYVLLCKVVSA